MLSQRFNDDATCGNTVASLWQRCSMAAQFRDLTAGYCVWGWMGREPIPDPGISITTPSVFVEAVLLPHENGVNFCAAADHRE